jgi:hypothetical protein
MKYVVAKSEYDWSNNKFINAGQIFPLFNNRLMLLPNGMVYLFEGYIVDLEYYEIFNT